MSNDAPIINVPKPKMIRAVVLRSDGVESKQSPRMINPELFDYRGKRIIFPEGKQTYELPVYQQRPA